MLKLNETDHKILELLRENGREGVSMIAERLGISPGAVRRRITRLEEENVIVGYTAVVNHEKVNRSIEAYVELSFEGRADVEEALEEALQKKGVREASTLAGEPDAIVRLRAEDVAELRKIVTELRGVKGVTGTKTLVALGRKRRVARRRESSVP